MKHLKLITVLLALLLAAMVMVPMVSAAAAPANFVDSVTAQKVATSHMKEIAGTASDYADWAKGSVQQSTTYYDLNDQKAAYLFNVNVNGAYSGYILVSATRNNYPVLEFSRGKVPDADPAALIDAGKNIRTPAENENLKVGTPKPIYLGGTFYYAQYPILNSQGGVVDTRYVDLSDRKVVSSNPMTDGSKLDPKSVAEYQRLRSVDSEKLWRAIDSHEKTDGSGAVSRMVMSPQALYSISSVPLWPWTLGCSPTAGGMILSYWRTHGYSSIPSDRSTLAMELYTAMGTNPSGQTSRWNVDNGMNTVIANHGYSYSTFHIDEDSFVLWSDITGEINAVKPFVLTMTAAGVPVGGTQSYGDHSVAVVGYQTTGGNFIVINDGLDTSTTKSLSFGNWAGAIGGYSRPA